MVTKIDMKTRYKACMVLGGVGDTIGFKNAEWEFNYGNKYVGSQFADDLVFRFIALGGVNQINLKGWVVSDDTILHMATAEALLEPYKNIDELGNLFKKYYIKTLDNMSGREPGITTVNTLEKLHEGIEWNKIPYNFWSGGAGASMRCMCIGLAFPGKHNLNNLISASIEASRITHNSTIGYLGGLTSALFTSYAIDNIPINEWSLRLVALLSSDIVDNYIKNTREFDMYSKDKTKFIDKWKSYNEDNFRGKEYRFRDSKNIPRIRSEYNAITYGTPDKNGMIWPGSGGDDSVIIAYDALIDAQQNWEKLIVFAILHDGDSDTTGSIALAWYGAIYGFANVPESNMVYLEYLKELKELGSKLFEKYSNNKTINLY